MIEIDLRSQTDQPPLSIPKPEAESEQIQPKKAIGKIFTLEPDRTGGAKQISKEFYVYSDSMVVT